MSVTDTLAPALSRLESASSRAVMARIVEAGLMERGAVAVISVQSIREAVGDRWPRRREDVWANVNRKCAEHLSHADIHARLNDTDFILAMTCEQGTAVQAVALRILEEVLVFFLGVAEVHDLRIQMVTGLTGDSLSCAPIDPTAISRRPIYIDAPDGPAHRVDPIEEKRRNPVSFVASSGVAHRIDFAVEEVVSLKHNVTAALRINVTVSEEHTGASVPTGHLSRLPDEDLYNIDRATLAYAGLYVPKTKGDPPVMAPASFRTLQTRKGRGALMQMTNGATTALKAGVLIELVDVDIGTPASRLTEVLALIGGLCRGIFIRLRPAKDMAAPVKGFRMQGLTLDTTDLPPFDTQVALQMLAFGEQARHLAPVLAVIGLPDEGFAHIASVAGITHVGMRAPNVTLGRAQAKIPEESLEILRQARLQA